MRVATPSAAGEERLPVAAHPHVWQPAQAAVRRRRQEKPVAAARSCSTLAEMALEKLHNDVIAVARLGNVHVVEEAVEHAFPHVQIGFDALLDEQGVGVNSRAELERTRARHNESGWKLGEHLR